MKTYYKFADLELELDIPDERMFSDARHLAPFRVESAADPHRFCFEVVDRLPEPATPETVVKPDFREFGCGDGFVRYIGSVMQGWQHAYARAEHHGKLHCVQLLASSFPERIGSNTVLTCMAAEHLVVHREGFLLHSSYIDHGGRAILFTAPSGTGKSTQAELWNRLRGARIINGDRTAVRLGADGPLACGVPFAGSSNICENATLPLEAIVYLKQAPVTSIRRLRGAEAFRRIWEGVSVNTWNREDVELVSNRVLSLVQQAAVYELSCTPDESAVIALEGELRQ